MAIIQLSTIDVDEFNVISWPNGLVLVNILQLQKKSLNYLIRNQGWIQGI